LLCENTAAIQFAKDPKFHRKTKLIKRHYHFVRNAIKEKEVAIKYSSTSRTIVDPLTKPIPKDTCKAHMMSLGLHTIYVLDVSKCMMDIYTLVFNIYEITNDVSFQIF